MNEPLRAREWESPANDAAKLSEKQRETASRCDIDEHSLVKEIGTLLSSERGMVAVGETSAGGALASLIHGEPTSAAWFRGGVVPYAGGDLAFVQEIQVVAGAHGMVSEEYAAALARLVRSSFACEWALVESGIAGPQTGRRSAKPVGTVCLAVAGPKLSREATQERGTSPRATGESQAGDERGTSSRATVDVGLGEEQVWATSRVLADNGRIANQHQFAVEALNYLRCVLSARRTVR